MTSNKDYQGLMIAYLNRLIHDLDIIYEGLLQSYSRLNRFLVSSYNKYLEYGKRYGLLTKTTDRINQLPVIQIDMELERNKINYYKQCKKLPIEIIKAFYSHTNITLYQLEDQVEVVNQQLNALLELSEYVVQQVMIMIDDSDTCMFVLASNLAMDAVHANRNNDNVVDIMDGIIEEINEIDKFYDRMVGQELLIDRKRMEEIYHLILTGISSSDAVKNSSNGIEDNTKAILSELKSSYEKLLLYAEIEDIKAGEMRKTMQEFINVRDKFSNDDRVRNIRKMITEDFYEIYYKIFLKAYKDESTPRLVDMFLEFGFADERLLETDQIIALYNLCIDNSEGPCKVYTIKEWLTLIYEGKKEPSKNEFDMDYSEMLNSLKKQGKIKDKELVDGLNNVEKKLEYEIQNMFRYNNRVTNGKISTFVPVLTKEVLSYSIEKLYLSSVNINKAILELMKIDFSVFDREVIYSNPDKNIMKEYIIKRVFPDVILMPTAGANGVMWQDITGKKRDSEGRFLLPIFTEGNLTSILIKILGRYRWELCRSIQGLAWNDIKYKSLTSEYSDYIQFYRKNKELSEEKREKVKLQIQKGKNNSKEVFVLDYEIWIKNEVNGAIKLNKCARAILATYCPFSKEIRDKLAKQPLFEEAMGKYNKAKLNKVKELESRYRYLERDYVELTQELTDTLNYWKET